MALLQPIGFWSYTSQDDTASRGRLSQLRRLLSDELQQAIGQTPMVRIFQDIAAIPPGAEWSRQIGVAITEAAFFIPIVTPGFLQSEWCARETLNFRERERALGRDDLIFPVYYNDVEDFVTVRRGEMRDPEVLTFLRTRQWVDFRDLRYRDAESEAVAIRLGRLAEGIRAALYRPSLIPVPPSEPQAVSAPPIIVAHTDDAAAKAPPVIDPAAEAQAAEASWVGDPIPVTPAPVVVATTAPNEGNFFARRWRAIAWLGAAIKSYFVFTGITGVVMITSRLDITRVPALNWLSLGLSLMFVGVLSWSAADGSGRRFNKAFWLLLLGCAVVLLIGLYGVIATAQYMMPYWSALGWFNFTISWLTNLILLATIIMRRRHVRTRMIAST